MVALYKKKPDHSALRGNRQDVDNLTLCSLTVSCFAKSWIWCTDCRNGTALPGLGIRPRRRALKKASGGTRAVREDIYNMSAEDNITDPLSDSDGSNILGISDNPLLLSLFYFHNRAIDYSLTEPTPWDPYIDFIVRLREER